MKNPRDNIITLPLPQLRLPSKKVSTITTEVKRTIEAMKAATLDWEDSRDHEIGVALAAIQINSPLKIVIIRNDFDNKADRTFKVFINPEIVKYEGNVVEDFEGCLSIKDIYGKIPRYERVKIKALDIYGRAIKITADGFLARIFQHEIDHTHGKVIVDHIRKEREAFFRLDDEGHLQALDYDLEIKNNASLWGKGEA